jgi:hypothetical protein
MSLIQMALIILIPSILAGALAYLVVSVTQLKSNKVMWEQAYTKLAIERSEERRVGKECY